MTFQFMTRSHDKRPKRVAEPVQVYLDAPERLRLDRLTKQLSATKSDVVRSALEALERSLPTGPELPYEQIIAIDAVAPASTDPGYDVAREHDRFLAEREAEGWMQPVRRRGSRRRRGG